MLKYSSVPEGKFPSIYSFQLACHPVREITQGAELFQVHCVGCHAKGGNIVRWWKDLKIRTLKRNKLDSVEAIAYLVKNGKNNISAYKERLAETEIEIVSGYVF